MQESQGIPEFLDMDLGSREPEKMADLAEIENSHLVYHSSWEIIDGTKLSDARRCLRRFMLAHIFGWKPLTESNHLVFGRAWHKAKEYLRLVGYTAETLEEAYQLFEKVYRADFPLETDADYGAKTPGNAALALAQYAARYAHDLDHTLYTEIADVVPISAERLLTVKIDAIMENQLKQKFFVDDKTGSESSTRWVNQWALSAQMSGYSHTLRMLWPESEVVPGYIDGAIFRKKGNDFLRVPIHRSDEMLEAWLWNTNWWWDQIAYALDDLTTKCKPSDSMLAAFPINDEGCQKYTGCEYHELCVNLPNPLLYYDKDSYLAGKPEAPPGYKVEFWNPFEEFKSAKTLAQVGLELKGKKS